MIDCGNVLSQGMSEAYGGHGLGIFVLVRIGLAAALDPDGLPHRHGFDVIVLPAIVRLRARSAPGSIASWSKAERNRL